MLSHHTIQIACEHFGAELVYKAAHDRIVNKDHQALKKVGLPDTETLVEAFAVMDVAIHAMPHLQGMK